MSITPVSDLVFDVVQAAEPSQYHASVAKFQSLQSTKTTLAAKTTSASSPKVEFDHFTTMAQLDNMRPPTSVRAATHKPQEAYRKFESLMLQNFINAMFADETPAAFGNGAGADYWKDMLVNEMADEMSQAGGIGLADMMEIKNSDNEHAKKSITDNITASANILVHKSQLNLIHNLNKSI